MLFDWLQAVRQGRLSAVRKPRRAGSICDRSLTAPMQRLEPRVLLTASPVGGEFQVNTYMTSHQMMFVESPQSVANDADGDYVVTWTSYGQDGNNNGIFAQRYNAAGMAQGSELQVNTYTTSNQLYATVAMDADGDFVVTWSSFNGQNDNDWGIFAQRYNAAGVAQGSEFQVNSTTTGVQLLSTVAMDADGDFVVSWQSLGNDGSGYGIFARRYNAAGVAQGSEFQVNTFTTSSQIFSRMAMDADGDFVVTWTSIAQDGSGYGVFAQRYNAAGVAQGSELQVNTYTTSNQLYSTVAMDADGDFVVTWSSSSQDGSNYGVFARQYNAAGVAQGGEFPVNSFTTSMQRFSTVAVDADGDFVVTWTSDSQDGSVFGVFAQQFNAAGVAQGTEIQVNTYTTSHQQVSAVAMDADGDFIVAWTSDGQDGDGNGVFAQRYDEAADTAGPTVTDVLAFDNPVSAGEKLIAAPTTLTVAFSEDLNVTGGSSGTNSVTNPANWLLTRNGVDVTNLITGITFGLNGVTNKYEAVLTFSAALTAGNYVLTAQDTLRDLAGNALDGDANGTPGGDFTRSFLVRTPTAAGGEVPVNTYTTNRQNRPSVAADSDGDYVVVWDSAGQDGSSDGIFAQRYDADGVAQGSEFQVNTTITAGQFAPDVAMDAQGNFVVSWTSGAQDGSINGIYAQRYNAAAVAQGGEFLVNTYTTDSQIESTIAMDADGDFVIAWRSYIQDSGTTGVYAQRFNAAGVMQGSEFLVNTYTTSSQRLPAIAMNADGDFVVTWTGSAQDGSGAGVFAQRFNRFGQDQGSEFQVNTYTSFDQSFSAVAMDAAGNFVITWQSSTQDGEDYGIYAQRYSADGVASGSEFLVNTFTTSAQYESAVAMDQDGDFVVTWQSLLPDGSGRGVFAHRYDREGNTQGAEFQVNTYTTGNQSLPALAIDADGDFVVAWYSNLQDGSNYGIYAQRYPAYAAPVVAAGQMFSIAENRPNGHVVGTVSASDLDAGDTITYALTGGNTGNAFSINSSTGQLTVNTVSAVNFETNPTFNLNVSATDQHGLAGSQTVTVNLTNLNEAPYAFGKSFAISENRPVGYVVGSLTTIDQDAGQTLSYSITGGNTSNAFAINAMTGQITVNSVAPINFELNPAFNLQITATDNGVPQNSRVGTAVINLVNLNEKPNSFSRSYTFAENRPNGYVVGTVTTLDPDAGQTLSYSITGGNTGNAFAINAMTGQLTVNSVAAINYEVNPTFTLQVTATDNGSPQQNRVGTVTINLTNLNEKPSSSDQTLGNIHENSPNGTVVGTVSAIDPDAGQTLTYAITGGNPNNAFAINSSTGQVRVNNSSQLDYETTPTFNLQITITDNGSPQQSRVITGVVNLINVPAAISQPHSRLSGSTTGFRLTGTASQETVVATAATSSTTPPRKTSLASPITFQLADLPAAADEGESTESAIA